MSDTIQLDSPNLGELEKKYLLAAIDSGYVSTAGPYVPEFEKRLAAYLGVSYCVSVQSGTAAIHMALYELGIGPGAEVIVPAITFVATVNPVIYVGATPVFVDINPHTWTIDPGEIEKAVTPRTKAVIPVHLYGFPCAMDAIMELADRYGLYVIEDATESLGATYKGRYTGTIGQIGCFSFNGNKVMTTGGGGMIATNNLQQAGHIKFLVNQGRDASRGYYHPEIGFNYRMTNLEAAMGLAQFERLGEFLKKKREFYRIYQEAFQGVRGITVQQALDNTVTSAWLTSVKIDTDKIGLSIPEIQSRLQAKGIPTRRIFPPIVEFPPYQRFRTGKYGNSYELYENGLNLPGSTINTVDNIKYVAESLLDVLKL
ncbi:MAG: aminotransferase class I/II-fold pyridoxal phosphate-dependent enzyme [Firmicutes bacterium]|nr:aminotransferase class I/II-fold pyridoxal phosphate-dependent enzyme [Bacillota bacterium]